jgi:phage recombination protein Bet
MATEQSLITHPRVSLVATMAAKFSMDPNSFLETVKKTVFPQNTPVSNEQAAAFLVVANQYGLNPFTREIYAFPGKSGGIVPVVGIDGWINLVNSNPQCAGYEVVLREDENGKPVSATCTIWRKDREHPFVWTEDFIECKRDTDPWKQKPKRMLKHKAFIQASRYAFGFAGIMDEDEAQEINITSASAEISRETNTKTDALKDKLGAIKKNVEKAAEKAKEVPEKPVEAPKEEPPAHDIPLPEPPPVEQEEMFAEVEDRVLTEDERKAFIAVIKSQGKDEASTGAAQKATRQKLMEFGYAKTADIKVKDYGKLMDWAKALKV